MPLSKLFHKRHSLKSKTEVQLPTQENVRTESNPGDCVDGTAQAKKISRRHSETPTSYGYEKTENMSKIESDGLSVQSEQQEPNYRKSSASSEDSQHDSLPEKASVPKANRSKNRSGSCKEARSVSFKGGRKKCDSESAAVISSTDDEGFDDKVLHLKEKDLEKVIGQCVNRLIRESIVTAVKSVNIDNLYEEVMKDISGRSHSESSDGLPSTIEQKLHTKSVTEYVDLEVNREHCDDEFPPDCETNDYTTSEDSSNEAENEDIKTDSRDASKKDFSSQQKDQNEVNESKSKRNKDLRSDGYQADIEESESCTSMHWESSSDELKTVNETAAEHKSSDGKVEVRTESSTEETSSQDANTIVECAAEKTSSEDGKVLKATSAEERSYNKLEEVIKTTITEEATPEVLKIPKETPTEETISNELKVDKVASSEETNTSHLVSDVDNEEKSDAENKTSESKELDDSEGSSAEESERKNTLKASEQEDLILMSVEEGNESQLITKNESTIESPSTPVNDLGENLPEQQHSAEEEKKMNWKMGYLQVKLPHKTRSKGHLKVWKKRCVAIQPDQFVHDPNNPCLMISVYSAESGAARKHSATFWKSVSGKNAVVYRSNSRTHRYAFTVSEDNKAVVHLAADSEATTQEWMAAIRAILWPPSPVVQLEKMLNGSVFEISIIDNDFSYHAGLLGMYGYLTITPKKLILIHPQQGYVIQEWYLNTVDKFQLMPQTRIEDVYKVLAMTTCSDSSTGKGDILIFCTEAVALLQSLASTIHQLLAFHSTQEGGIYQKELEEITEWLVASHSTEAPTEDHYKVPPRQVKSLLDIPNFIFDKPMTPVASVTSEAGVAMDVAAKPTLEAAKKTVSRDSGISAGNAADDFLNCSITSFVVGGGAFPGKSSDSELSDSYTPPQSPAAKAKTKQGDSKLAAEA